MSLTDAFVNANWWSAARTANPPIDLFGNNSPMKDVSKVKTPTIFLIREPSALQTADRMEWFEKYIHTARTRGEGARRRQEGRFAREDDCRSAVKPQ